MNPKGVKIADLREVTILRNCKKKELASIKSVHVYGSDRCSFEGPSALYITKNDEVFLAGFNSLVGTSCSQDGPSEYRGVLEKSVKVFALSRRSVCKIVVGAEFGAALTSSNELYLWGSDLGPSVPTGVSPLFFEHHYDGLCCQKCSQKLAAVADNFWSHCNNCEVTHVKIRTEPPPASWKGRVESVLGYVATDGSRPQIPNLFCVRCEAQKPCDTLAVGNYFLLFCKTCRFKVDGSSYQIPPLTISTPHKVQTPLQIIDLAAGMNFLLILTHSKLIIWGNFVDNRYNHAVRNPDEVVFAKVACGSTHIAVISDKGDLYTCGAGDKEQLGYTKSDNSGHMTLKKVETLTEPVVDVACGKNSTVCLLQNGTYVRYGGITKIVTSASWSLNLFDSVVIVVPSAVYYVRTLESILKHHLQLDDLEHFTLLTGDVSDAFILLHGLTSVNHRGVIRRWFSCIHDFASRQVKWIW